MQRFDLVSEASIPGIKIETWGTQI